MKRIILLAAVFCSTALNAQEVKSIVKDTSTQSNITTLTFSVDSSSDFESINWEDIKEVFENNSEEQIVKLVFEIDLPKSKNKFKGSLTVSGESKKIDELLVRAKKRLKGLIKIIRKYENNEK